MVLGHHDRAFEPRYFDIRRRMMESGVAMRNFGSAALQLAHVASGRLDGAQSALDGVRKLATGVIDTAISVRQSGAEPALLAADAKSRLGSMFEML